MIDFGSCTFVTVPYTTVAHMYCMYTVDFVDTFELMYSLYYAHNRGSDHFAYVQVLTSTLKDGFTFFKIYLKAILTCPHVGLKELPVVVFLCGPYQPQRDPFL